MATITPKLQPIVNEFSECERSDIARLLIHANDLYHMYNNTDVSESDRQLSLDNALKLITQVIKFDPDNAPAMNLLGRIELDRGNISAAQNLFEKCLEHSPNNTQYLTNMGYLHIIAEEPGLAIDLFQKALDIDKSYKNAFLGIARAHHALNNYDIAYLHYRTLIQYGYDDLTIQQGMLNCCAHIKIEQYTPQLEADLFHLLANPKLAHERLGGFAAALICKKYDLSNPNAAIDIIEIANDPLIYYSLLNCTLPEPHVEELITALRQSIVFECYETGSLRDELQVLAISIAVYNERNNFSMISNEAEENAIEEIDGILRQTVQGQWTVHDIAGAVIIVGMYKALFSQSYSVMLTALDLEQWPNALQPLMKASLYRRAEREAFKQQFPEKQEELLIAKEDLPAPYPRRHNLEFFNQTSLKSELATNFGIDKSSLPDRLLLLVAGRDAAQRALEYANHFTDVDVLAVESSLENLAECHLRAQEKQLNNVVFWPNSMARKFLMDGNKVDFASITSESATVDQGFLDLVKGSLTQNGVLNFKLLESPDLATEDIQVLISKQNLKNTAANIKALRTTILEDKYSAYWSGLINNDYFYSVDGCRQAWFGIDRQKLILNNIIELMSDNCWELSKVLNHYGKVVSTELAKKNLTKVAKDTSITKDYSVYLIKN